MAMRMDSDFTMNRWMLQGNVHLEAILADIFFVIFSMARSECSWVMDQVSPQYG